MEPKKTVISSIRNKLLAEGFVEEVEYDSINVEPVLIYSRSEERVLFVKHKWALVAMIPIQSEVDRARIRRRAKESRPESYEITDESGSNWLSFQLPKEEAVVLKILNQI